MKNFLKVVLIGVVTLTVASADANKGQKLYAKKLKSSCEITGADFAKKHTVDGWSAIGKAGMVAEIKKICPNAKESALKDKYMQHYLDFAVQFASDSGNVPSC
jgi:hypothetical protein